MALADIIDGVYTITNRPDLTALTFLSIQKATLKEHSAIDYPRDLVVIGPIVLDNSEGNFKYSLSLATLGIQALARKFKVVRELIVPPVISLDTFKGYWGQIEFEEMAPNNIFDHYQQEKPNYYIRQGNSLNLVAIRAVDNIALMYYQFPNIAATTYDSWIADMYPYVIQDHAAANVFQAIGKSDEFAIYARKIQDNRLDVIRSEIGAIG